jgi:carbamate kinase
MRIVIALADDALRKRGVEFSAQQASSIVRSAAAQLAQLAEGNDLVIVQISRHGASRAASHDHNGQSQQDTRCAIVDGEFGTSAGYALERELGNLLPSARVCTTLAVSVEVDLTDPAFQHLDTPVGPIFSDEQGLAAATAKQGLVARGRIGSRRVVPSPQPMRLAQSEPLRLLVEQGMLVLCTVDSNAVIAADDGGWYGVEAVIDPHAGAALVAETVKADLFIIATSMAGVFLDWGTANSKLLRHAHPNVLSELVGAVGAMAPKLRAAARFAEHTGRRAAIGALADVARLVEGTAGTTVSCEHPDPRGFAGGAVAC